MLRFEGRDLKPYAEPISEGELAEGAVYFSLTFIDENALIPVMEPVVCLGRDPRSSGNGEWYFQDAASYFSGRRVDWNSAEEFDEAVTSGCLYSGSLKGIFTFERALDNLLRCSIERGLQDRDSDKTT